MEQVGRLNSDVMNVAFRELRSTIVTRPPSALRVDWPCLLKHDNLLKSSRHSSAASSFHRHSPAVLPNISHAAAGYEDRATPKSRFLQTVKFSIIARASVWAEVPPFRGSNRVSAGGKRWCHCLSFFGQFCARSVHVAVLGVSRPQVPTAAQTELFIHLLSCLFSCLSYLLVEHFSTVNCKQRMTARQWHTRKIKCAT